MLITSISKDNFFKEKERKKGAGGGMEDSILILFLQVFLNDWSGFKFQAA